MRGLVRNVAVVLLSFALGLHWAALQSVAWTSMFVQRVQHASVTEALRTTFDGKHPCALCLVVRDGRAAERQSAATPNSPENPTPRLESPALARVVPWVFDPGASGGPLPKTVVWRLRSDPPPLPPPRVA